MGVEALYILCPFITTSLVDDDRQEKPYGAQSFITLIKSKCGDSAILNKSAECN